jgi:hypothetical protein
MLALQSFIDRGGDLVRVEKTVYRLQSYPLSFRNLFQNFCKNVSGILGSVTQPEDAVYIQLDMLCVRFISDEESLCKKLVPRRTGFFAFNMTVHLAFYGILERFTSWVQYETWFAENVDWVYYNGRRVTYLNLRDMFAAILPTSSYLTIEGNTVWNMRLHPFDAALKKIFTMGPVTWNDLRHGTCKNYLGGVKLQDIVYRLTTFCQWYITHMGLTPSVQMLTSIQAKEEQVVIQLERHRKEILALREAKILARGVDRRSKKVIKLSAVIVGIYMDDQTKIRLETIVLPTLQQFLSVIAQFLDVRDLLVTAGANRSFYVACQARLSVLYRQDKCYSNLFPISALPSKLSVRSRVLLATRMSICVGCLDAVNHPASRLCLVCQPCDTAPINHIANTTRTAFQQTFGAIPRNECTDIDPEQQIAIILQKRVASDRDNAIQMIIEFMGANKRISRQTSWDFQHVSVLHNNYLESRELMLKFPVNTRGKLQQDERMRGYVMNLFTCAHAIPKNGIQMVTEALAKKYRMNSNWIKHAIPGGLQLSEPLTSSLNYIFCADSVEWPHAQNANFFTSMIKCGLVQPTKNVGLLPDRVWQEKLVKVVESCKLWCNA